MTETETERIDNIVEDLTQSAAADALLGACSACSHPSCERKRQAERDTQIAGQELATYIATLRAQLAGVRERATPDVVRILRLLSDEKSRPITLHIGYGQQLAAMADALDALDGAA